MDQAFIKEFRSAIEEYADRLRGISEVQSQIRPQPKKWSPKEIMGHLVDSASNNHQRFIRAQFKDDLVFPGYQQDDWVAVQEYQTESWLLLIETWKNFNLHLLHSIAQIPVDVLTRRRVKHNLHEIAWITVPENQPATLEYFIRDYLVHMKHHLTQIFPN